MVALPLVANIYKRKGQRSDCGNYRGLSLLDVAGKFFVKVMASQFNIDIAEKLVLDSQCGFRADRSTSDSIFVCRQLLKIKTESNINLSALPSSI